MVLSKPEVSESRNSQKLRLYNHKVKYHVDTVIAAAASVPVPLTEWHMALTCGFSKTTKTSQILDIKFYCVRREMAKSTSHSFLIKITFPAEFLPAHY